MTSVEDQAVGVVQITVGAEAVGTRLDRFLAQRLERSRRRIRELLAAGSVRLDGRNVGLADKGLEVAEGGLIEVSEAAIQAADHVLPQPEQSLRVLAEGEGWLAIDKSPGTAVHPLRGGETGTVLNAVVARHPEIQGVGEGGLRSGVVHRLDVDTSGALLLATTAMRWEELRSAFTRHRVGKIYRALVHGRLDWEPGARLEVGLRVQQHRNARVVVSEVPSDGDGDEGQKEWRATQTLTALETFAAGTLVEVRPETGFLHQIRATLAHLGHPVLGDATYGSPEVAAYAPRHMLHAAAVEFGRVRAESPDPADFVEVLERLRG
ncbi:MAG: RNA pseudouridine synthase [Erythrobacter sp.]|nr:RNA pseudouridine synthase [Erythrobacter sp.]